MEEVPEVGLRVGIDIGGTFTDLVLTDEPGRRLTVGKVLTDAADPARGVMAGLERLLGAAGVPLGSVGVVIHGTTLAANAIIERKGGPTGLLTTAGFRDIIETGKELRYDLYDIDIAFPKPLVPRRWRLAIRERTGFDGTILTGLDPEEVERAVRGLLDAGMRSLAICFLHAYANPANEQRALAAARQAGFEGPISLSSRVLPEIGEHGRFSTTVANAYVQPLVSRYLEGLERELNGRGFSGSFLVTTSNGGTMTGEAAREFPVRLIESGPAAGAYAAAFYGSLTGRARLLSFDMGGTTAKMCLIAGGQPSQTTDLEVARLSRFMPGSGIAIRVPAIDMVEIGAGGGSVACVDPLRLLVVGPESAGADPGPACYRRGGTRPTVTDADLLLGYLNPGYFLGGAMTLDEGRAREAVAARVGRPLGLEASRAALSVFEVVNENMANAIAVYAAHRGQDVRESALFAFGGAGPVHAWAVARRLGIAQVVAPFAAGVMSALGGVLAPLAFDFMQGYLGELDRLDLAKVNGMYAAMEAEGRSLLIKAGAREIHLERTADMRYLGQRYDVTFPLPSAPLAPEDLPGIRAAFYRAYQERYGRYIPEVPVEAVNFRLAARSAPVRAEGRWFVPPPGEDARAALKGSRPALFREADGFVPTAAYDRYRLPVGARLGGPAVVEDRESTLVIPPGAEGEVDPYGALVIQVGEG
jgi:N-methylhydantoinase A